MQNRIRTFLKQTTILTSLAMGWVAVVQPANANPEGGQVVAGSATISNPDPSTLLIEQDTDRAVINWGSFNIAAGETTQFVVPDAESWTLNRVVGTQSPSLIYGSILSNGNVVIVNPDGMLFGAGATVDVNRLIATTADIGNGDFMAGRLTFGKPGKPSASIVNLGTISAADYGLAALVAPSVRNSGIITARLGTVALAAGNSFTIDPYGDGLIKLAIGDEVSAEVFDVATGEAVSNLVQNDGTLSANGGTVAMTAATARRAVDAVINTTGVVEARSVGVRNGMIVLGAGTTATKPSEAPVQAVKVSGTLDATGTDPNNEWPLGTEVTGGRIEITGEAILATDATIDASGRNGGGTVLIGGDYLGGNIDAQEAVGLGVELEDREVDTASLVVLDETVTISADATQIGDGGKVIVWSDDVTLTAAEITARGGAESGDGGFIETSGKNYLSVLAAADASATNGLVGTWLMDPVNIRIVDGPDQYADVQDNYYFGQFPVDGILVDVYGRLITPVDQYTLTPDGLGGFIRNDVHSSDSIIDSATIEAALNSGTSVFITNINSLGDDPGTISIEADINKTGGGDVMLNFNAASDIYIADGVDITNSSGRMILYFVTHGGGVYAPNMGTIDLGPGEGQLLLAARDGGVIRSSGSIPYAIQFDQWVVPAATGSWNVRFAGGDRIGYDFTPGYVTFGTDAINLTGSQMGLSFILGQDVRVYDNAIFVDNQSSIAWLFVDDPDASMAGATISNNIPEIASDGVLLAGWRSSTNVGVGGWLNTFPVLEVAEGMNPATQCGGITCVPVTPVVVPPAGEVPQVVLDPDFFSLGGIENQAADSTPLITGEGTDFTGIFQNLAIGEVADLLTRGVLELLWKQGLLNVWGDQLDQIALEGMVQSKFVELAGGPQAIAGLGQSFALDLLKTAVIEIAEEIAKQNGLSPYVIEPTKYLASTMADYIIFSTLYPEIATQAPVLVAITAAAKNSIAVIIEASVVGFDAYKQHAELVATRELLDAQAKSLTDWAFTLKRTGTPEQVRAAFELARDAGKAASEFRKLYPYESLLQASWPGN